MKVSTRGDYATRALLSIVLHGTESPTSVKEIAERTDLPQPYLEQILLAVKGAGLVRSKRGVGGGYVLARDAEEITLADIIVAVDGPIATRLDSYDHHEGHCVVQDVWVEISERMRSHLHGITLAELARKTLRGIHPHLGGAAAEARAAEPAEPAEPGNARAGETEAEADAEDAGAGSTGAG